MKNGKLLTFVEEEDLDYNIVEEKMQDLAQQLQRKMLHRIILHVGKNLHPSRMMPKIDLETQLKDW